MAENGQETFRNVLGPPGPSWPLRRHYGNISQPDAYSLIHTRAMSDEFEGKQTDWGCWVTMMTQDELLDFINECYGKESIYPEWKTYGKIKEIYEIREFVQNLNPKEKHMLVALEH